MIPLSITLDIEKTPWADLKRETLAAGLGQVTRIGRLPCGMTSGKASVSIVVRMPDGSEFIAQASMALFLTAAAALKGIEDEMSGSNARN